jgi:L-ascorbate metabolism protein UlaG (beta-lactamase superfamily)
MANGARTAGGRRFKRWALYGLLGLVGTLLLAAAVLWWALQQHPSLAPYADLRWQAAQPAPSLHPPAESVAQAAPPATGSPVPAVPRVTFMGVSTVLIDDGETALLTDGFFSRPGKWQTLTGRVQPDPQAITAGLARAGLTQPNGRLAAVIPVHSHYDHAMDAPEVARRTGALLLGSASTAQVGRGWGLPEAQMRIATLGQPQRFGRFTVTLYPGRHVHTGMEGGEITTPLHPPVRASDYKEGQSYVVHIAHGDHRLLIVGSAGYEPGALRGVQADVVLLGIGTLGRQSAALRQGLWDEAVTGVGARLVLPIHWDDFWLPAGQLLQPLPLPLEAFAVSMDFLRERAAGSGVTVRLPLAWQAMDLWASPPQR